MSFISSPMTSQSVTSEQRPVVITGGAGFIGANLAARLMTSGERVVVFDKLHRQGAEANLKWLSKQFGDRLEIVIGDVCDSHALRKVIRRAAFVFHLAAQVAVTTSFDLPFADFDVNARGTLNILESIRELPQSVPLVFTSTNKVYGALRHLSVTASDSRYVALNDLGEHAVLDESRPLDPESPYGCSKAAADQYVRDYARCMGVPAIVFRMSCIYGPRQHGTEDQGWVAHVVRSVIEDRQIVIYGDGRQVRDVLYIDDLVNAMLLARKHASRLGGRAFNIGGGLANTLSILELIRIVRDAFGAAPRFSFADWRRGDQLYYVSDTRAFERETGWRPATGVRDGMMRLARWLREDCGSSNGAARLFGSERV